MSASVTNEEEEGDAAMWDRLVSERRRRGSHACVGCALGRGELGRGGGARPSEGEGRKQGAGWAELQINRILNANKFKPEANNTK